MTHPLLLLFLTVRAHRHYPCEAAVTDCSRSHTQVAPCGHELMHMEKEKHSMDNQERLLLSGKDHVLYNAFVQDALEFLMLAMVPTEKKMTL